MRPLFLLVFISLFSTWVAANTCSIVFDAGSSKTSIFAFHRANQSPNTVPVQIFSSKINTPIASAIKCGTPPCSNQAVLDTLNNLMNQLVHSPNFPLCASKVERISLFATAGMRLAEQDYGQKAVDQLYYDIKKHLGIISLTLNLRLDPSKIVAKTLSGQEEAIFAWTSYIYKETPERLSANPRGILEIGGASMQIAYPCLGQNGPDCQKYGVDINIGGVDMKVMAYSWLGLGRDEANKVLNAPNLSYCNHPLDNPIGPGFDLNQCINTISKSIIDTGPNSVAIYDVFNYLNQNERDRGIELRIPPNYLFHGLGGLSYYDLGSLNQQINLICGQPSARLKHFKDAPEYRTIKYTPEHLLSTECFARNYYNKLTNGLRAIQVTSVGSKVNDQKVSWAEGAAICLAQPGGCFVRPAQIKCRWRKGILCAQ
jgi:hypothetical protein